MATTAASLHRTSAAPSPLALWHLLSLDAPTVACLWTLFLARANHIALPLGAPAAMFFAVWLLYAADRILDARPLDRNPLDRTPLDLRGLEPRHLFHHRHRTPFLAAIALASLTLAGLLPHLPAAALHLYLAEGALLAGYFLLLHAIPASHPLPKEFAVGLFFAAAVFIPTVSRSPGLRSPLLPAALLLAALCILNGLFIYDWEHPGHDPSPPHPSTQRALRSLRPLGWIIALAGLLLALAGTRVPWQIGTALTLSTLLLLALDRQSRSLPPTTLRAAADLVLLTPALFLPFLR